MSSQKKTNEIFDRKVDILVEYTKITNLNNDCLEAIFEHLDFKDIIHAADACKQFNEALCRVYKRKYLKVNPIFDRDPKRYIW